MKEVKQKVILTGTWLYGDTEIKQVHVIKTNFKPGTGDLEDEAEIRNDEYGTFYGVHFGGYEATNPFLGGAYKTIDEAKLYAATVCPSLSWNDS